MSIIPTPSLSLTAQHHHWCAADHVLECPPDESFELEPCSLDLQGPADVVAWLTARPEDTAPEVVLSGVPVAGARLSLGETRTLIGVLRGLVEAAESPWRVASAAQLDVDDRVLCLPSPRDAGSATGAGIGLGLLVLVTVLAGLHSLVGHVLGALVLAALLALVVVLAVSNWHESRRWAPRPARDAGRVEVTLICLVAPLGFLIVWALDSISVSVTR